MDSKELASVAQTTELLSKCDSNPQYNNNANNQLILYNDSINSENRRAFEIQLLSKYEKIGGVKSQFRALKYFYEVGASFGKDIERKLGVSMTSSHRIIEKLLVAGFIEALSKTYVPRRSGKRTIIYGVQDVTKNEIDQAISRFMQLTSKNYRFIESLYQKTLGEIENESIQWLKIVAMSRKQGNHGFNFMDIAHQVERLHNKKGVKVWH